MSVTTNLLARLGRVAAASIDPSSYRLLASTLRGDLVAPSAAAGGGGAPATDEDLRSVGQCAGLPRVIFQTWKSKTDIPENYAYWRSTFFRHNPDHFVLLWDDDDNRAFIARHFPWFLPQYDAYPREIFRADIVCPFFLFRYGGFYADMDSECIRPISAARLDGDVVLGRMGRDRRFEHAIPNAIMASRPGQAFWLAMIALAIERFARRGGDERPEFYAGPVLLRDTVTLMERSDERLAALIERHIPEGLAAAAKWGKLELLSAEQFYPVNWNNPAHQIFRRNLLARRKVLDPARAAELFPGAAVVTYWSHSW